MGKNRSIEAKRIKYLKQMKARPRFLKMNYGHIKVSQSNSKDHIPREARALFEYRDRAKEHDHSKKAFLTTVLDTLFPNLSTPIPKPREVEHMRLKVNSLEPTERKMLVQNGRYCKVAMLSNNTLDCVEFLEYQLLPGILRRSISYGSYDRAMAVFHMGTIRWKEVHLIPNVENTPLDD